MQAESGTGYRRPTRRAQIRRRRLIALGVLSTVVIAIGIELGSRGSHGPASSPTRSAAESVAPAAVTAPLPAPVPGKGTLVFNGPANSNRVALTFDDGSCDACIGSVLATLERTGTRATLFPNGAFAHFWNPHAAQIRKLIASGQIDLGNHTWSHNDVRKQSATVLQDELERNEDWMRVNFGGSSYPIFRPPFGAYDRAAVRRAGQWGWTTTVTWSAGSRDWEGLDADAIVAEVAKRVEPGSIVLLHANYPTTAAALPRIIAGIQARGLELVTLHDLLGV
jgi:peptidoglycan/xylan/chitin deacetylase (PgdA/CDA1 family)